MKVDLPLMKNMFQPLAKIVSIPLGLTEVVPTADAGIPKNILGWRDLSTLVHEWQH